MSRDRAQALRQLRQTYRKRVVGIRQRRNAFVGGGDQVGGVGEPRLRGGQVAPFGFRDRECHELAPALIEEPAFGGGGIRRMRCRVASFRGGAPRPPAVGDFARKRRESAEGIDQMPLRLRFTQRLVRVLAVDGHERRTQLGELRQRGRTAVDPRPALALRIENPAQQDFVAIGREFLLGQPRADGGRVGHFEFGRELRALGAGSELPHFETIAEQQAQRVEQDRLARSGFAGEHREAIAEFDIERGDDDKVANRKRAEHGEGVSDDC